MINHLRTLLLNQPYKTRQASDFPGEEIVPTDYEGCQLTGLAASLHMILFGVDPDRAYRNWRLREYLGLIRAGELSPFETRHDPRLTYQHGFNERLLCNAPYVHVSASTEAGDLILVGSPQAEDAKGRILYRYALTVDGSQLQVQCLSYLETSYRVPLVFSNGLSQPIALPGSSVSILVPQITAIPGNTWDVETLARPNRTLPNILNSIVDLVGSGDVLFPNPENEAEAFWRQLWRKRDETVYRLPVAVLALGEWIETLRVTR